MAQTLLGLFYGSPFIAPVMVYEIAHRSRPSNKRIARGYVPVSCPRFQKLVKSHIHMFPSMRDRPGRVIRFQAMRFEHLSRCSKLAISRIGCVFQISEIYRRPTGSFPPKRNNLASATISVIGEIAHWPRSPGKCNRASAAISKISEIAYRQRFPNKRNRPLPMFPLPGHAESRIRREFQYYRNRASAAFPNKRNRSTANGQCPGHAKSRAAQDFRN